jgi:hypothetical protein
VPPAAEPLAAVHRIGIYHNTVDLTPGPQSAPGIGCPTWTTFDGAATQLIDQSTASNHRTVLWNSIVSRAALSLSANVSTAALNARSNLFDTRPTDGIPRDCSAATS